MSKNNSKSRVELVKKRKMRKWLKLTLLLVVILGVAIGAYATNLYLKAGEAADKAYEEDDRVKSDLREEEIDPKYDHVSILLLGVDENDKRKDREIARTDAIVLATLNRDSNSVKLVSIPRDSLVYIPQVGYEDKINHAHAFGEAALKRYERGEEFETKPSGSKAVVDTVENLLDIPVDYYAKVNFKAFVDIIDALGGIDTDVPYEFKESNSEDKRDSIHLMPGEQRLNGEEALALARTRKQDSDYMRGQRQLQIIDAIIDKATSLQSIFKYDDVIKAVGDNMSTNMSFKDMKSFSNIVTGGKKLSVEQLQLEGYDYQPNNVYYWQLDQESVDEIKLELREHLELETDEIDQNSEETENVNEW